MTKFAIALLLAVAISIQDSFTPYTSDSYGAPTTGDDITAAAAAGNWEEVKRLIQVGFDQNNILKSISSGSVKDLKPIPGGHVYGEAQYTFHSATNYNGHKSEQSGGHKIINDNGKVSEFYISP